MNRILLISGGLLIAIVSIIRFYSMPQSELTQVPVLIPVLSTYAAVGIIIIVAGIVNKVWLNTFALFLSSLFLILLVRTLFMGQFGQEWSILLRIIGFALVSTAALLELINYKKNKKTVSVSN